MARKTVEARLAFKQSLKGCANAELLKRLKALHTELAELDQETIATSSLDSIAKELITPALLLHKERGVKAYIACCLVDILRLYAPEAPYTERELKDLFQFLFRQLKHLTVPTEPHFSEYFYVVESLHNVKSIVIICDLESADELVAEIFKQSFDVISSNSPKNVEICVAGILCQVLDELQTVPNEVIDTLLAQFLPKNVKHKPASYRLAVDVCTATSDRLQRHVCQYFAEVITSTIAGSRESDESEEDTKKGAGKAALPASFVSAHTLIKQVNRSVPSLLLNVIPQLEEELQAEKPEYRKLAAEVLGAMFGEKTGQGDLAAKYPGTWKEWIGRLKDKVPAVRVAMVEGLRQVWTEHSELGKDIEAALEKLFADNDDKVRAAACTIFEELDYETALHHVSKKTLVQFGERCRDRKASVRSIAFTGLARLYSLAFPEIDDRDEHAIEHFAWIPGTIYEAVTCAGDTAMAASIRAAIDRVNMNYILPLPKKDDDEAGWVDRLLVVARYLNEKEFKTFLSLTRLQERRPGPFDAFIKGSEANNGGVIDANAEQIKVYLKRAMSTVASRLPDPTKALEDLKKFIKANEKQLYKLFRILMDPQTDLKLLVKSHKEVLRRLEQVSPTIVDTFIGFIRHSCYLLVNRSSIPTLLKRVQTRTGTDGEATARVAVKILDYVSKARPALYKTHVAELMRMLGEGGEEELVRTALYALSKLAKSDSSVAPDKAKHFAKNGTPMQAKFAATIIALDAARPGSADDVVEFLADALPDASDADVVSHLAALSRFARHGRDAYENKIEQITTFALETLNRGTAPEEEQEEDDSTWVSDDKMANLTNARILAIKTLTNHCLAFAESAQAAQVSEPVFNLLWPFIQPRDEGTIYNATVESRLRLVAALSLLKMATKVSFQAAINKHFDVLARTSQDACFEVRSGFISRLMKYLREDRIATPARYNMIFFLVAHDPDDELRTEAEAFVQKRAQRMATPQRQVEFEHPFVRFIHLLAHHPDFEGQADDVQEMKEMAKYIQMYITCLATQDNIPYLQCLALRLKTVRDAQSSEYDDKLYILSDLAQHLISLCAKAEGWSRPSHPNPVKMPGDVFKMLPNPAVAKEIAARSYISATVLAELAGPSTKKRQKEHKVKAEPKAKNPNAAPKARKPRPSGGRGGKRAKKVAKWNSDDEDASDPVSEADDSDEEKPTPKKKARGLATTPPPAVSKRAGLRGPQKGLGKPRALVLDKAEELSDLSDEAMDED